MEILITGLVKAEEEIRKLKALKGNHKPTYVIRIYSYNPLQNKDYQNFKSSKSLFIRKYEFDDVTSIQDNGDGKDGEEVRELGEKTAKRIILDFALKKEAVDYLLVHCRYGEGRSPAVFLGLNDLFDLGEDSSTFVERYPKINMFVYEQIIKAGYNLRNRIRIKAKAVKNLEGILF